MAQNPWNKTMLRWTPGLEGPASLSSGQKKNNEGYNYNSVILHFTLYQYMDDVNLVLVSLAVAATDPVSYAPQTEAKESENAGYREQSDCPENEAVPATHPMKYLCIDRNSIQVKQIIKNILIIIMMDYLPLKCLRIVVFTPFKHSKLRGQKIGKLLQNRVIDWCLK